MLGTLVLKLGHAAHLAHIGVAVEQPVHFGMLMHMALEEENVLLRIKPDCQQQRQNDACHRAINLFHAPALLEAEI